MAAASNDNVCMLWRIRTAPREAAKRCSGGRDNRCADKRDIAKLGGAVTSTHAIFMSLPAHTLSTYRAIVSAIPPDEK